MATKSTKAKAAETAEVIESSEPTPVYKTREVDQNQIIVVHNGFQGKLVYIGRSGERFVWDEFDDEQEMELRELRNAKSSAKAFYENNWFMFDDDYAWVISYLGLERYYKNSISLDAFDSVFEMTPAEIKKTVSKMPDGQKQSLGYRARIMIEDGNIDSNKVIAALEEALGFELVERER